VVSWWLQESRETVQLDDHDDSARGTNCWSISTDDCVMPSTLAPFI